MTSAERVIEFAQSVYLTRTSRYFDGIEETDGQVFLRQTVDWTNQFIEELEMETDNDGQPIDWDFLRENDYDLGKVPSTTQSVELDDDVDRLVVNEDRPLVIMQDGSIISRWTVVNANQVAQAKTPGNMVMVVNRNIIFSRALDETELGGDIVADVVKFIPRLTLTNADLLDVVRPKQLLVLGVAKNATLPDIVQGGISPSLTQKYGDLLTGAKARSALSSIADTAQTDDYSYISGVGI